MARKRKTPDWVKEKADAAERRAKGLPLDEPRAPIDPPPRRKPPRVLVPPGEAAAADGAKLPKYKREFAATARKLCQLGATDRDLAEAFGVTTVCIWQWQCRYKEFFNSLRVGKAEADERVKRSLYQRAVGYSYDTVKINQYEGTAVITPYVEHVPPDVGAAKLWMINRCGWREKIEHTGPDGGPLQTETTHKLDLSGLEANEREALRAILSRRAAQS